MEEDKNAGLEAQERRIAGLLGFTEVIAILMVGATAFSGFATWRTSTIAEQIMKSSERPYIGVQDIELNKDATDDPAVTVDYRDFGHIPADDVRIRGELLLNGDPLTVVTKNVGIMSPQVRHVIFLHLPKDRLEAAMNGGAALAVRITARYRNTAAREFCYSERFTYSHHGGIFEAVGGTSRCDESPAAGL